MHLTKLKILITILLLGSKNLIQAKRLKFKIAKCDFNPEIFSNFSVQIPNGVVNLDCVLEKTLQAGLRGHLSFEFRTSKTKPFQNIIQYDLDYCSVLKATTDTLSRRWYQSILQKGNISAKCPLQPGYTYMHGWRLEGNLLPSFLAIGDYRIEGSLYYGKFRKNNHFLRCTVEAIMVE